MPEPADASLQLKKRARRRLVGAVAFAGLAAVVLPMVMDEEPKQQVQDVQIRIPGQDQSPFNPKVARSAAAGEKASPEKTEPAAEAPPVAVKPAESAPVKAEKKSENVAPPVAEKAQTAPAAPSANPPPPHTPSQAAEARRAADILAGKSEAAASGNGQYIILIGAFANPANVRQLQTKIGELGIKVFTEALDAPDGKKTRVRAGPFPNPEAAEKALEKMKRIGVNGVVARQ